MDVGDLASSCSLLWHVESLSSRTILHCARLVGSGVVSMGSRQLKDIYYAQYNHVLMSLGMRLLHMSSSLPFSLVVVVKCETRWAGLIATTVYPQIGSLHSNLVPFPPSTSQFTTTTFHIVHPVLLFYRLGHPENHLFSLSKQIFSGSKYPKKCLILML